MQFPQSLRAVWTGAMHNRQSVGFAACVVVFVAVLGASFYLRGQTLMADQLRRRLRDTAAVAAEQFDPAELKTIEDKDAMKTDAFRDVVGRLKDIRAAVPGIRYVYIMRRTGDDNTLAFVADADSLATDKELDKDGNGRVDDYEEASYPGDPYDIRDVPALHTDAFERPTVDPEITHDQWGALISGYAPVKNASGAVAIVGVDMDAGEYTSLARSIFSPVAILLACLMSALFVGYVFMYLWKRKLEVLQRLDEERAGLMLIASHQLGSPLTIFQWSLEELEEDIGKPSGEIDLRQRVQDMRTGVAKLKNILQGLREASQMETGQFSYKPETVYLRDIIVDAVHEAGPELKERNQKVTLDLDQDIRLPVDRKWIGLALRELLENAMIFSRPQSSITISAKRRKNMAEVEFRDQGCGIPAKDLPRMFGKFVRGSNAHLSRPDGNGLGLFIAKKIVERAGGKIEIESKEGEGTVVRFTLPIGNIPS